MRLRHNGFVVCTFINEIEANYVGKQTIIVGAANRK